MKLISAYTRSQAIDDGVLIDVSEIAREAGLRLPTAVTSAVWTKFVRVPSAVACQDEDGRLWDILWMLRYAIVNRTTDGSQILFDLFVKNNDEKPSQSVTLKAIVGPGDDARPVLTVMLPNED